MPAWAYPTFLILDAARVAGLASRLPGLGRATAWVKRGLAGAAPPAFAGPGGSGGSPAPPGPGSNPSHAALSLERLDVFTTEHGSRGVHGMLVNRSGRPFASVRITLDLRDAAGARIGGDALGLARFEPHATWRFSAPLRRDDVSAVTIARITAS